MVTNNDLNVLSILEIPDEKLTPGMLQYKAAKLEHPDCLVLLRMGDFYEIFYEDAAIASRDLEITLTARGKGEKRAPLAGIPYHALDSYLGKLVSKGHKVAIVEQLEDPKKAKGLVKRGVVRVVTPGTVVEQSILDSKSNNYLMGIVVGEEKYAFAVCDISTGEFFVGNCISESELFSEVCKWSPSECILADSMLVNTDFVNTLKEMKVFVSSCDDFHFRFENASKVLNEQKLEIEGFSEKLEICVSGGLIWYLCDTQKNNVLHIKAVETFEQKKIMKLDRSTIVNLELFENVRGEKGIGTLLSVIDRTSCSMGARMLKKIVKEPLLDVAKIDERLDAISLLNQQSLERDEIVNLIKQMADLERLIARVNLGNASPKDLLGLKNSLFLLPQICTVLSQMKRSKLLDDVLNMPEIGPIFDLLEKSIKEDAGISVRDAGFIKKGFNSEVDELTALRFDSKSKLAQIEAREKSESGIDGMKISYNRVFGYFIEVRKKDVARVPAHFVRKQTTSNAERYFTQELKVLEEKILGAQDKLQELEYNLFLEIVRVVQEKTSLIQEISSKLALLDLLCCLSVVSMENGYCRPSFVTDGSLEIVSGRHPVIEHLVSEFIPNDVKLVSGEVMIITGPNTSGKSCVMRQTALIILLAQIGSFVPAESCVLSIVDKIFTRVGAHDDISLGQSTFMVEMLETARILSDATESSFIVLDEIGRGTSTFDGVSIAWSCVEYIYSRIKAKTMFATHYHVLNKLAGSFELVKNYNLAVREVGGEVVFLRKLVPGSCDKSHGVYVAKLAGMPVEVVSRAREIQRKLMADDSMARKVSVSRIVDQKGLEEF